MLSEAIVKHKQDQPEHGEDALDDVKRAFEVQSWTKKWHSLQEYREWRAPTHRESDCNHEIESYAFRSSPKQNVRLQKN